MVTKKKGQAAMEFLMTYGWAILVVLVVIGALAYFGVLNPQSFLPKKCQFVTGLVCEDHLLTDTVLTADDTTSTVTLGAGLRMRLNNGLGNDIRITKVTFAADNNIIGCETDLTATPLILPAGDSKNINLMSNLLDDTGAVVTDCASELTTLKGTRVKGEMVLSYEDLQTQFAHNVGGTLLTDIE